MPYVVVGKENSGDIELWYEDQSTLDASSVSCWAGNIRQILIQLGE